MGAPDLPERVFWCWRNQGGNGLWETSQCDVVMWFYNRAVVPRGWYWLVVLFVLSGAASLRAVGYMLEKGSRDRVKLRDFSNESTKNPVSLKNLQDLMPQAPA